MRRIQSFDETLKYEPKIWSGVIDEPKINTEPVISRMSYKEGVQMSRSHEGG